MYIIDFKCGDFILTLKLHKRLLIVNILIFPKLTDSHMYYINPIHVVCINIYIASMDRHKVIKIMTVNVN